MVAGGSQGGALAIAAGSLEPGVRAVVTDVPFLSDFPRAAMIADVDPYPEIARYLRVHRDHTARVFATLAHFDVSVVGRRATAPALFSLGLMDRITPPSTVYAAFHAYGGPKELGRVPVQRPRGRRRRSTRSPSCAGSPTPSPLSGDRDDHPSPVGRSPRARSTSERSALSAARHPSTSATRVRTRKRCDSPARRVTSWSSTAASGIEPFGEAAQVAHERPRGHVDVDARRGGRQRDIPARTHR